jgi:hypothetical protein
VAIEHIFLDSVEYDDLTIVRAREREKVKNNKKKKKKARYQCMTITHLIRFWGFGRDEGLSPSFTPQRMV